MKITRTQMVVAMMMLTAPGAWACSSTVDDTAGPPDALPLSGAGGMAGTVATSGAAGTLSAAPAGGALGIAGASGAGVVSGGSAGASGAAGSAGATTAGAAGFGGGATEPEPPAKQVPRPLNLWVLDNHNVPQAQWGDYARWYTEPEGVRQVFRLYEGDETKRGDGVTSYARLEVHGGLEFKPGADWYTFEATYQINTELQDDIAIAQLFEYSQVHPQIMFIFKQANVVTFQPRGKGNRELGSGYKNKPFTIKMRSNGRDTEVYFNGMLRYSGPIAYSEPGARNGFRWGLYYGKVVSADIHSVVTGVTREKE